MGATGQKAATGYRGDNPQESRGSARSSRTQGDRRPGFFELYFFVAVLLSTTEGTCGGEGRQISISVEAARCKSRFASVNPTGPLHVGHGRVAVMGDVLARLHKAVGFDVEREYYVNDAGKQMENLGRSLYARYQELLGMPFEFPVDGYPGDYVKELAEDSEE